jgi:ribosomal protein S18 acetylase RimI-like enzyme
MDRHPHHDAVAAEVARWYREPTPEMGYDLVEGRFGWFNRPASTGRGRGTVRAGVTPDDVEALIAEAEGIVASDSLSLELDDRATAAAIGPALEANGFQPGTASVHLAYLGGLERTRHEPAGLRIDDVPADGPALDEWATLKLQAFADSEAPPADEELQAELVVRRAEMAGQGRALAARIEGEPVAVAAFYEGDDRFIFVLGTRVPFRHLGIGRALLAHVVHDPGASGCRSVLINADEGGRPEALYRRLGFTDEVHWRRPWTRRSRAADGQPVLAVTP